jgi:hypothetical protein
MFWNQQSLPTSRRIAYIAESNLQSHCPALNAVTDICSPPETFPPQTVSVSKQHYPTNLPGFPLLK